MKDTQNNQSMNSSSSELTVVEAIFGTRSTPQFKSHWSRWILPVIVAISAHTVLFVFATQSEVSLETWSARIATLVHKEITSQSVIRVERLTPPPPPPPPVDNPQVKDTPPPPPPKAKPKAKRRSKSKKRTRAKKVSKPTTPKPSPTQAKSEAPPPAAAGKVIAAQSQDPVDLTQNVFVTGQSSTFVGGVTTASGTGQVPTMKPSLEPKPTPATPSRARRVSLSGRTWRCDWPSSAMKADIYEQSVIIKVVVNEVGKVEEAKALDDPGFGFGKAAVACALKTTFSPALNRAGKAIRATSPPIRVRFTR